MIDLSCLLFDLFLLHCYEVPSSPKKEMNDKSTFFLNYII